MTLLINIDHLAAADGIVALTIAIPGHPLAFRGVERWQPVLSQALDLLALTDEPSIRIFVGEHTLVIQREGTQVIAVATPTGHAIAKSLRRMIRRMSKRERGPYIAPSAPLSPPLSPPLSAPQPAAAFG